MAYFLNLFSPETYAAFKRSLQDISGFRHRHRFAAERIKPGDKLVCYLTKLSRWFGILEVVEGPFQDSTPIFYPEEDPFVVRFRVKPPDLPAGIEHLTDDLGGAHRRVSQGGGPGV